MAYLWARDAEHLEEIASRIAAASIPHFVWREPDGAPVRVFFRGQPLTAVAAGPVEPGQRELFSDLEKVSFANSPVVSTFKTSASKADDVGGNPTGRASLPCS